MKLASPFWKRGLMALASLALFFVTLKADIKWPDTYNFKRGIESLNDNPADAYDWLQKEVSENPKNGYAYLCLSWIDAANQEYGKALNNANLAIKLLGKKDKEAIASAYDSRGDVNLVLGDSLVALEDYTTALKYTPTDVDLLKSRGELYFNLGKDDLSNADYQKIIELEPGNLDGYMGLGNNCFLQQQFNQAKDYYDKVIKLAPDNSRGYLARAVAYYRLDNYNDCVDDIIKVLEIDGDNTAVEMINYLPPEAVSRARAKLKIEATKEPTNRFWPYVLGNLEKANDNFAEAINYYTKANHLDAHNLFLEYIAQCYAIMGNYPSALEYVDKALDMAPEDTDLMKLKALILESMGRFEECVKEYDRYIEVLPENPTGYLQRAEALMSAKNFARAVDDYNMAMLLDATNDSTPYYQVKLGDALRLSGKPDQALPHYRNAIALEADSALTTQIWTPFALTGLGETQKAISHSIAIATAETTDLAGTFYNFACILARSGRNQEAVQGLQYAVDAGYDNFIHMGHDYDLDPLREMPEFQEIMDQGIVAVGNTDFDKDKILSQDKPSERQIEVVEVPFTKEGGVTKVKCNIHGLPLHFVFDTGAAEVTMSMVEANFMVKNDYIKPADVIGSSYYVDANGDVTEGTVINLKKVNFGGLELENVRASVVRNQKAPLLLGQSVLGRLGKIEIDNPNQIIRISHWK